jgi:hypothetical protein
MTLAFPWEGLRRSEWGPAILICFSYQLLCFPFVVTSILQLCCRIKTVTIYFKLIPDNHSQYSFVMFIMSGLYEEVVAYIKAYFSDASWTKDRVTMSKYNILITERLWLNLIYRLFSPTSKTTADTRKKATVSITIPPTSSITSTQDPK